MGTKRLLMIPTAVLVAMALLACKGGGETSESSRSSAAGEIGVAECDEYVNKYEKCVSENVPAASRGQLTNNATAMRASWKQAASNPAAQAGLAQGCKQALATAKTAMASYGCQW
jgi:hypothetical protein